MYRYSKLDIAIHEGHLEALNQDHSYSGESKARFILTKDCAGIAVLLGQSKTVKHEIETKQKSFLHLLQNIPIQMQVSYRLL